MIRPILNKTPYELFKGRKPNIMHLTIFGCKCYVHNNGKDTLGKFDPRSDEAIILGYFSYSKAYKVFNKRTFVLRKVCMCYLTNLTLWLRMMHRMKNMNWALQGKICCSCMRKVSLVRMDQGLEVVSSEGGKSLNQSGGSTVEPSLEQN